VQGLRPLVGLLDERAMKTKTEELVTVWALMWYPARGERRSLCAIFSTALKAERFAKRLRRKLSVMEKKEGAAYFVDAWHVDGAR
jgi:hypothetical protein